MENLLELKNKDGNEILVIDGKGVITHDSGYTMVVNSVKIETHIMGGIDKRKFVIDHALRAFPDKLPEVVKTAAAAWDLIELVCSIDGTEHYPL